MKREDVIKRRKLRELRAVDMAEYIYDKLSRYGALTPEVKEILEKIIVEIKDHTFEEIDNIFGITEIEGQNGK